MAYLMLGAVIMATGFALVGMPHWSVWLGGPLLALMADVAPARTAKKPRGERQWKRAPARVSEDDEAWLSAPAAHRGYLWGRPRWHQGPGLRVQCCLRSPHLAQ